MDFMWFRKLLVTLETNLDEIKSLFGDFLPGNGVEKQYLPPRKDGNDYYVKSAVILRE